MAVAILGVHIAVIIDKVLVAGIIRRIDVDNINISVVGIGEFGEGGEVVALNDKMVGGSGIIGDYGMHFAVVSLYKDR